MGNADEIAAKYASRHVDFAEVLDCSGMCVLPGLVDGHTHPVFAGDRVHEFAMKVQAREENCTSLISVTLIIHEESGLSTCNKMSVPRFPTSPSHV